MSTKRANRVAELIKREVSRIIIEEIKDPEISLVTITNVQITNDLRYSKIYFTVIGDREKTMKRFDHATKFIRNEIGRRLNLRYVPEVKFVYDALAERVEHIEHLFSKIKSEGSYNQ